MQISAKNHMGLKSIAKPCWVDNQTPSCMIPITKVKKMETYQKACDPPPYLPLEWISNPLKKRPGVLSGVLNWYTRILSTNQEVMPKTINGSASLMTEFPFVNLQNTLHSMKIIQGILWMDTGRGKGITWNMVTKVALSCP